MRVLIIDDDEDVVFSLQTILCAKGVEVVGTGTDGSEAVKLYEELQPDILLMDIQMKPMNGLDAAEQILAEDKTARVLFLTTFSDDEYIGGVTNRCERLLPEAGFCSNCSVVKCSHEWTERFWWRNCE